MVSCRKERLLIDRERFGYLLSSAVSIREREYKLDSRFHFEECESIAMVYNKLEELDGEIETAKNAGSHSHPFSYTHLERQTMMSGWIPIPCKSLTLAWVGFVFNSSDTFK